MPCKPETKLNRTSMKLETTCAVCGAFMVDTLTEYLNKRIAKEHFNSNLPPVGIGIKLCVNGEYVSAKREKWAGSKNGMLEFVMEDGSLHFAPAKSIKWKYYD